MRIEILSFDGCPNAGPTEKLVREAASLEAPDAIIDLIKVETPDLALRVRFMGSPSVRIDGEDIEPSARARAVFGLMCRTYGDGVDVAGTPSIAMIRTALRRHIEIRR